MRRSQHGRIIRETNDYLGLDFGFFLVFWSGFVVVCGLALRSASMASSKLNGQRETGFAFGIQPPMVSGVEHSWPHTSSEPAVPVACSAVCYNRREDIRILPVVMTERELGQIQRQIGFADVVIGAHHATLEQAPEG